MHRVEANSERRIRWIARIAAGWMLVLGARLVDLQIRQHETIKKQAQHQQERQVGLHGVRGSISDENGQPLAISVPTDSVWVSPARIKRDSNLDTAALVLATGLKMDQAQIRSLILKDPDKRSLRIARQVSRRESSDLCGLSRTSGFDYMWCEEEELREHPAGNLAAHVLGPVGRDHSGQYGIERSLETELAGQHGKSRVVVDSASNAYQEQIEQEAKFGTHLRLTLNADIQYAVEQALARQAVKHNVARGTATVLDPRTGAILAMASYPNFELSKPPAKANDPALVNLAVKYPFEPGSVFKTITMAAAIETTDLRPQTMIDCGAGVITIGGFRIRDVHGGGVRSMEAVYANSMNTGSIRIGQRVGSANLRHYIQAFGFGQKTGIELPEEPGYVQPGMQEITRASQSIGYAVNVTSLQLARATAVIANGGLLVKPYLVASRRGPDGIEHVTKAEPGKRIISPETAITMRRMMEAVMLRGTGRRTAKLEGYTSGGKTGTARYYDTQARKYINGKFNASFAGMAPLNDPRIVVVVNYFGTHGEQVGFGGAVAAPVFREIAHASLRILGIPPDPNLMREGASDAATSDEEVTAPPQALPAPVPAPRTTSLRPAATATTTNDFSLASVPYPLAHGGRQNVSHPDDRGQRSFSTGRVTQAETARASRKTEP